MDMVPIRASQSDGSRKRARYRADHSILLFVMLSLQLTQSDPSPVEYCPSTQRYDIGAFPPRCIDCARILSNRMQVARVSTSLLTRRTVQKFSPGMPQNQTCGCWNAPANQVVFDVVLNASWIVSGLAFGSGRKWWLKEFEIQASNNNDTFMPWGVYSMSNFTAASVALFPYPIRARYFRVTVRKYVNHLVNSTLGYPLSPVQALVSHDQPFSCGCPMLSNGECCPFLNMTVRNDQCVWCMDPTGIRTFTVDGCAKCKAGTFEFQGMCYLSVRPAPINSMSVGRPWSDGIEWRIQVNYTTDPQSTVLVFIANQAAARPCEPRVRSSALVSTCCINEYYYADQTDNNVSSSSMYTPIMWNFTPPMPGNESTSNPTDKSCRIESILDPPSTMKQFVQFDRGRQSLLLSFTKSQIHEWAVCDQFGTICTGSIGALFLTTISPLPATEFLPQLMQQPLRFDMAVPSLVCATNRTLPSNARVELHYYAGTDTYTVRTSGAELSGGQLRFQWAAAEWIFTANAPEPVVTAPPNPSASLRIGNDINMLRIDPPITPIVHGATRRYARTGILVEMYYGFGFGNLPQYGDTDQIVIVIAKSTQPVRLKRLTTSNNNGETTMYTNTKGFISDSRRVMDLGLACYQDKALMVKWLLQAIQLLDTTGIPHAAFIQRSCQMILSGAVAKAFWLVPWRGGLTVDRMSHAGVEVAAEFA